MSLTRASLLFGSLRYVQSGSFEVGLRSCSGTRCVRHGAVSVVALSVLPSGFEESTGGQNTAPGLQVSVSHLTLSHG